VSLAILLPGVRIEQMLFTAVDDCDPAPIFRQGDKVGLPFNLCSQFEVNIEIPLSLDGQISSLISRTEVPVNTSYRIIVSFRKRASSDLSGLIASAGGSCSSISNSM